MTQGGLVRAVGRVRSKKKNIEIKKNPPHKIKKHEIHRRPVTATHSRRRATKYVPRGSPYSCASSIDPGFAEISLACIRTYSHCCCCVACIRFRALFSRQRSFCFLYCYTGWFILCGHQGGGVSAPYAGRTPHGREPNAVVHFDYLYMARAERSCAF